MKLTLFSAIAVAATLLTTSANATAHNDLVKTETIYIASGTTLHFQTSRPFKNVYYGGKDVLTVEPGITDQDLNITANAPDKALTGTANVLVVDENGQVVDNIKVEVTPFGRPSRTIQIVKHFKSDGEDKTITAMQHCSLEIARHSSCIDAPKSNNGMGDPDRVSKTTNSDGSTSTTQTWSTPRQ